MAKRLGEVTLGAFPEDDFPLVRFKPDLAAKDINANWLRAPNCATPVGAKKRERLMGVVVQPEVALKVALLRKRHLAPEVVAKAPPLLAREHLYHKCVGMRRRGDDQDCDAKRQQRKADLSYCPCHILTFP